jgi:hypothetical protein
VDDLDALVGEWLPLPDVADKLGIDVSRVRQLVQERQLISLRRGERRIPSVPAALLLNGQPLQELRGTLVVLSDAGYDDEAAVRWLFTEDPTLPGSPVDALRAGRKAEIRRRAQAMAF